MHNHIRCFHPRDVTVIDNMFQHVHKYLYDTVLSHVDTHSVFSVEEPVCISHVFRISGLCNRPNASALYNVIAAVMIAHYQTSEFKFQLYIVDPTLGTNWKYPTVWRELLSALPKESSFNTATLYGHMNRMQKMATEFNSGLTSTGHGAIL
jgi:hypothetical protein